MAELNQVRTTAAEQNSNEIVEIWEVPVSPKMFCSSFGAFTVSPWISSAVSVRFVQGWSKIFAGAKPLGPQVAFEAASVKRSRSGLYAARHSIHTLLGIRAS